ncbi:50S ribosomal protein L5 [Patescibacteria group bacterium]|nr:50S ribosomal protein L5 [Patescibacteria group bacterium]MBU2036283.1 50S ribosomal protein L5 [Patescibacteria group bacterium]
MNRLQEKYQKEIMPKLKKEFDIKNDMAVPKPEKVTVNMGVGSAVKNKELRESLAKDISIITGQRPSVRLAKISVAGFSLRQGMPVGLAVTLRGDKMYSFLDRLFSIVLPRLRDFRGLSRKSLDSQGNYTIGMKEHTIFPEIDSAKSNAHGMEITIVTNSKDAIKSEKLLEYLGMPFEKKE